MYFLCSKAPRLAFGAVSLVSDTGFRPDTLQTEWL